MARTLASKPNTVAPGGAYPYGDVKDNTGANDGTNVNKLLVADFLQFFERLMALAGVSANGLPENNTNSWQYITALQKYVSENLLSVIESTDADNCIKTGFYDVAGAATNIPLANEGYLMAQAFVGLSGQYVSQMWFEHTSDRAFFRRRTAGVWTAWVEFANKGDVNAKVSKSGDIITGTLEVQSGIRTQTSGAFIKTKIIQTGDWNIYTTGGGSASATKLVAHGLGANFIKIRKVSVQIIRDDSARIYDLASNNSGGGIDYIDNTNVNLVSLNTFFNSTDFQATSFNRGFVTIDYEA